MDSSELRECYNALWDAAPDTAQGLGWFSREAQEERFEAIASCIPGALTQCSILDVGCGDGAFARWLVMSGYNGFRYLGVDSNQKAIASAGAHLGSVKSSGIKFGYADVSDLHEESEPFDFVVCSGLFFGWEQDDIDEAVVRLFGLADNKLIFNFKTAGDPGAEYMIEPSHMLNVALSVTPRLDVFHGKPRHDCLMVMEKVKGEADANR